MIHWQGNVCLILGDNIFYGQNTEFLKRSVNRKNGATIFGYQVSNPNEFGIIEFNKKGKPIKIREKPKKTNSRSAVTGLYFFDNNVVKYAEKIDQSGEVKFQV